MAFIKHFGEVVVFFFAVLLAGCAYEKDMYPYQPLVKPPKTVESLFKRIPHTPKSFASELVGKGGRPSHLWWKVDFLTSYKADEVVDRCLDYLAEVNASPQTITIPIELGPMIYDILG